MPKRTNDFQKFVAVVERLSGSPTAKIIESAMVLDRAGGKEREIDLVIEDTINGFPVRIAIECRDHKRTEDVQWIDELIGRFRDIAVDAVIAVSSSGFSSMALEKARNTNIRAYTIRQALDADAQHGLYPPPLISWAEVDGSLVGCDVRVVEGEVALPVGADYMFWRIEGPNGEDPETVYDTSKRLFRSDHRKAIREYVGTTGDAAGRGTRDCHFDFFSGYSVTDRFLVDQQGTADA